MSKRFFLPLFLSLAVFTSLPGCGWWPSESVSTAISKPLTEQREFRHLVLENGLKVLLISDPKADKAAASLDVNVGSRQDPVEYQGLAHFLEHMLFLGTKKYPEGGEYQAFITANGGSHNAYTSFEHTNYFFDIAADSLEPALDRFAQFFVAPLFNAEYVQREVNAVDSEYQARIRSDGRRELSVFKSQLNSAHPFSKFSVGNLTTLQVENEVALRQALLDFYQRYYSAELMSLTVAGTQSLDALEKMVRGRFVEVKKRNTQLEPIEAPLFMGAESGAQALPRWVNIVPVQNRRSLSIQFPVADAKPYWQSKPLSYLGNILGHEGQGSLLSALKHRGWAEGLSAGQSLEYQGGALFGVDISLTEAGLEHTDEIIDLVYASIHLLKTAGIEQWRFDEQAGLARQEFLFRAQPALIQEVVQLSGNLQEYPPEQVIEGPFRMETYRRDVLASYLDAMRPENSYITLVAPGLTVDQHIERYQVDYGLRPIPNTLITRWQNALASGGETANILSLPRPNAFIASDFSLLNIDAEQGPGPRKLRTTDPAVELWLNGDAEFGLPKGRLYLLLESPDLGVTPPDLASTSLWLQMVKDQLNEQTYPASLAGLSYQLSRSWRGVELSISGFNEKQAVLLGEVLKTLKAPEWQQARFDRLQAQMLRSYENRRQQSPYQQVMAELPVLLDRNQPQLEQMITAVKELSLDTVQKHVEKAVQGMHARMLVDGNFNESDAVALSKVLVSEISLVPSAYSVEQQIVRLARGKSAYLLDINHEDASLVYYLQAPAAEKQWRVAMGLAAQMMSAEFYHQLRTKKQLGYIVNAGVYPQRDVGGLMFLVQSPVMDAAGIQSEVEAWISSWAGRELLEQEFDSHKTTLLKRLRERPENLWEAAERNWNDLLEGYEDFDSREQLAQALENLSYSDFSKMMSQALRPGEQRGLYLFTEGRWANKPVKAAKVSDVEAFKLALPAYSFQ